MVGKIMNAIWALTIEQLNESFSQAPKTSYTVVLDQGFANKYSPEKGIYLAMLLLAILMDKHATGDINDLRSDQLRTGTIKATEDTVALSPKAIEQEFIKLNWTVKQMTYFNLRVRRWLSERKKATVDEIGKSLYLILQDIDSQAIRLKNVAA